MKHIDSVCLLETFFSLCQYGQLGKAAETMRLTKSSVLRRINTLESKLGYKLFLRDEKGFVLTSQGLLFHQRAHGPYEAISPALHAKPGNETTDRIIHVSASYTLGTTLLLEWLAQFQAIHPTIKVNLDLTLGPVPFLPKYCDFRFTHADSICERVHVKLLGYMPRMMVASPRYLSQHGVPKIPQDLLEHNLLGSQELVADTSTFTLQYDEEVIRLPFHTNLLLSDHTSAREAALAGCGIAVHALKHDVLRYIQQGTLVPVLENWHPMACPINLLFPVTRKASESALELASFFEQKWKAHPILKTAID